MSEKNGGAAFPRPASGHGHGEEFDAGADGMTLRDYFAAHALILCNRDARALSITATTHEMTLVQVYAAMAYEVADAMLAERTK